MVCFFLYDIPGLRQDLPGVIRSIALKIGKDSFLFLMAGFRRYA